MKSLVIVFVAAFVIAGCGSSGSGEQQQGSAPDVDQDTIGTETVDEAQPDYEMTDNPESSLTNLHISMHEAGVDFFALGNEPFWSLNMTMDKVFVFRRMGEEDVNVPPVEPDLAQDADVRRYRIVTEAHELIITLNKTRCEDTMVDRVYPYSVRVEHKTTNENEYTTYSGCGAFTAHPRLHNIWAVEEVNGEKLDPEAFPKGIPTLEIYISDGRVSGHDGCNQLSGSFSAEMDTIHFDNFKSTLMACPGKTSDVEVAPLISNRSYSFNFEPRGMVLTAKDGTILRLRNVD